MKKKTKEERDMDYLLTFLEGMASFISPCILPMIPLYLSYFAGGSETSGTEFPIDSVNGEPIAEESLTAADAAEGELSPTGAGEICESKTDADKKIDGKKHIVLLRSVFFVIGFTLMFVVFGGLAGLVSGYINKYKTVINIVAGVIVIIFGLSYIGLFGLPFFKGLKKSYKVNGAWSAFLFGIVFAVGVGP